MTLRISGILMHPSSLPSFHGIGDLGPAAYRFADFLAAAGQGLWQMLPVNPTEIEHGNSPYHSVSAFAGDPLLIDPEALVAQEWLKEEELVAPSCLARTQPDQVIYADAAAHKERLLDRAYERFESRPRPAAFERFRDRQAWVRDYALYLSLKEAFQGNPWNRWPPELRERQPEAVQSAQRQYARTIEKHVFRQFIFFHQWFALKSYCNQRNIRLIGDLPIYMPLDSADVWVHQQQYKLDADKQPEAVSGVPPDYFSETGQLWGHPLYRWEVLQQNGFGWWLDRFEHNLRLFDILRVDHFRGLVAYWEVPAKADTAVEGRWNPVPTQALFNSLFRRFGRPSLIAEDLGTITADVREAIANLELPGMLVLQFAFGDDFPYSSFLPHFHRPHNVVYTGTHDNNTSRGWYDGELSDRHKENLSEYLGRGLKADQIHWEMIRMAMMSVARMAVFPMQDVLGLGQEARMNLPAASEGNWRWRMLPDALGPDLAGRLARMAKIYGRV